MAALGITNEKRKNNYSNTWRFDAAVLYSPIRIINHVEDIWVASLESLGPSIG